MEFNKQLEPDLKEEPASPIIAGQAEPDVKIEEVSTEREAKVKRPWLIPIFFILIAIVISISLRVIPLGLPVIDDLAEESILQDLRNQAKNNLYDDYGHLPAQNQELLIQREINQLLQEPENKKLIKEITTGLKEDFKNSDGTVYLHGSDPYLWYAQADNVLQHGHQGDKIIDGKSHFTLRDGRLDKENSKQLHPYIIAYLHKFDRLFGNDSLMRTAMYIPILLIALAIIPIFLIAKKSSGNVGGLFAAIFLGINIPLLSRSFAGFSDTDPYNVLLPLIISSLFLIGYQKKIIYTVLAGLFVGIYSLLWGGWAFIFFFIIASLCLLIALKGLAKIFKFKKIDLNAWNDVKNLFAFFASSALSVSLLYSPSKFFEHALGSVFRFLTVKQAATINIWPKVQTTVQEFQSLSFSDFIRNLGGETLLIFSAIGLIFILLKKDNNGNRDILYFVFLLVWLVGATFSVSRGARFVMLLAAPMSLALGAFMGVAYQKGSNFLHDGLKVESKISQGLVFGVLCLMLISPIAAAAKSVEPMLPVMNDAWVATLEEIRMDSDQSIITSWWDFGYFFIALAKRSVTFDGGDQKKRLYWVGKTLITDDEREAVGILRMLNCGQDLASDKLEEYTNPLEGVKILSETVKQDRTTAYQTYLSSGLTTIQAGEVIELSHCNNLIQNYFITSQDMVNKARSWAHFGSWDFNRAAMYQATKKMGRSEAVGYLQENFQLEEAAADRMHADIQNMDADEWVAPWPTYISTVQKCIGEDLLLCEAFSENNRIAVIIDPANKTVKFDANKDVTPTSLVINGEVIPQIGNTIDVSVVLLQNSTFILTHPLLANSLFTRLYFDGGKNLECFQPFHEANTVTENKVITWKIDYSCLD